MRKSPEDTWRHLESAGREPPRRPDGRPFIPEAMPAFDDDELGFSYFRCLVDDEDISRLTLPRTFFGRSRFLRVRFIDTDLSESRMCWNDFDACDFSDADLSGCDMRASAFRGCRFVGAVLRGADLRRSRFEDCDFTGADLTGAIAAGTRRSSAFRSLLDRDQQAVMAWTDDEGPEPPGG